MTTIRDGNLRNKKIIKDALKQQKDSGLKFRRITDPQELADTLIFNFPELSRTKEVVGNLIDLGVPTKNLPDALDWHFAGKWNHMFNDVTRYKKSWHIEWAKTSDLLERSISIPILCNWSKTEVENLTSQLLQALK